MQRNRFVESIRYVILDRHNERTCRRTEKKTDGYWTSVFRINLCFSCEIWNSSVSLSFWQINVMTETLQTTVFHKTQTRKENAQCSNNIFLHAKKFSRNFRWRQPKNHDKSTWSFRFDKHSGATRLLFEIIAQKNERLQFKSAFSNKTMAYLLAS